MNSPIRIFFKNQDELFEIFQNFDFVKINPKEIQKDKAKKMLYFVKNGIDSTKQFIGISMDFFTDSGDLKLPAYPDAWNKEGIWSGNTI